VQDNKAEAALATGQKSYSDDTTIQETVSALPEQTGIGTGAFYGSGRSTRPIRKPKWLLNC